MKKTLLIMAAGMGSRYGGLKQVDKMGPSGETLFEYSVFDAIQAGFDSVVFIISEAMREQFPQIISKQLLSQISVHYVIQSLYDLPAGFSVPSGRIKPWGTSQAILAAREIIKNPFAVINADDFYGREAFFTMSAFLDNVDPNQFKSAMVAYYLEKTLSKYGAVSRGICQVDGGYLKEVSEIAEIFYISDGTVVYRDGENFSPLSGNLFCSMNFWGFTPSIFKFLEKDFLHFLKEKGSELKSEWLIPNTVGALIKTEKIKVRALESPSTWFGVTYPEDKKKVSAKILSMVEGGKYPNPLFGEKI